MRAFAPRIEIVSPSGDHIRYIPAGVAAALCDSGGAVPTEGNGRIKSVKLVATAATHAQRIGPPTGGWGNVRFVRREKLDGGFVVWAHHPRCLD